MLCCKSKLWTCCRDSKRGKQKGTRSRLEKIAQVVFTCYIQNRIHGRACQSMLARLQKTTSNRLTVEQVSQRLTHSSTTQAMKSGEDATEFVVRFHVLFSLLAAFALRDCLRQTHFTTASTQIDDDTGGGACANVGNTVLLLVVFWHLTIFLRGLLQYPRLLSFYRFLLPLSVWFIIPDWFLSKYAQTLEFPRNGALFVIGGAVNPYMAGMWSIPRTFDLAVGLSNN